MTLTCTSKVTPNPTLSWSGIPENVTFSRKDFVGIPSSGIPSFGIPSEGVSSDGTVISQEGELISYTGIPPVGISPEDQKDVYMSTLTFNQTTLREGHVISCSVVVEVPGWWNISSTFYTLRTKGW